MLKMSNTSEEAIKIIVDGQSSEDPIKWETDNLSFDSLGKVYASSFENNIELCSIKSHPVLIGYLTAYKDHLPMIITPDIIWQLILMGFTQHLDKNSSQLRKKIVDFEGKKILKIKKNKDLYQLTKEDWNEIINDFCLDMKKNVKEDLMNILIPNFSTTSIQLKQSAQITIMSSMKQFFEFKLYLCGCGIPYINLKGTLEDWETIKEKTEKLKQYDLEWWIKELIPILDKIIESKKGNIDINFWKNFIRLRDDKYTYHSRSGKIIETKIKPFIDGWIIKFFPYDFSGKRYYFDRIDGDENLPQFLVESPLKIIIEDLNMEFQTTFKTGFIGVKQDSETYEIKPEIGWYLVDSYVDKAKCEPSLIKEFPFENKERYIEDLNDLRSFQYNPKIVKRKKKQYLKKKREMKDLNDEFDIRYDEI